MLILSVYNTSHLSNYKQDHWLKEYGIFNPFFIITNNFFLDEVPFVSGMPETKALPRLYSRRASCRSNALPAVDIAPGKVVDPCCSDPAEG
ncbi:MAG: hypothetical protein E4G96_06070 [Chrysiogenales bacterium]|nr:MAG: hypothetical protein E4G96_06070 [Chrysiogenales bacterium]